MAGLTKTYTGDLGQAIAGKIWDVIKNIDEEKKIDDSGASKEVKDAAKKLLKDDPNSVPVKDKDLRETISKIFLPIESQLVQTKSHVDGMSAKITSIGGGIADTQKLIINQNQILEDKLDLMLSVIGTENWLAKQAEEQHKFNQIELGIDAVADVADTFGIEKTSGGSLKFMFNFFQKITGKLISEGRGPRSRAARRFLWQSIARFVPARVTAKLLGIPVAQIGNRAVVRKTLQKRYTKLAQSSPLVKLAKKKNLFLTPGEGAGAGLLNASKKKSIVKNVSGGAENFVQVGGRSGAAMVGGVDPLKNISKITSSATTSTAGRKIAKKGSKRVTVKRLSKQLGVKGLARRFRLSILGDILKDEVLRKKLIQKLGPEGVEKLGRKAAKGAIKGGAPLVGTAYGAVEGIARLVMGDPKGMMLSFGSAIPIAGWGFTILDILRDIDRGAYERHLEPYLPFINDDHISRFFMDALGMPPQYERGTPNIMPNSPNIGGSIQEIVGATLAIGRAAGVDTKMLVSNAGLGSVKPMGTYNFDLNPTGTVNIATQTEMIEDRELPKIRKLKGKEATKVTKDNVKTNEEQRIIDEKNIQDSRWWIDPRRHLNFGNTPKGEGGNSVGALNNMLTAQNPGVKIDASGESGVDFTPDGPDNRAVFDGYVSDIGHQYNPNVMGGDGRMGAGYGHYIGITSVDPKTGQEFEGLYAHFPEGELDRWSIGDTVKYGDVLGRMGTWSDYANPETRYHVGSGTGPHTSLDFFVPGTNKPYPHWRSLVPRIDPTFSPKPNLNPPPLPPIDTSISPSLSPHTNLVNKGSSERLIAKRQASVSSPIVMVNNNIVKANSSPIVISSGGGSEFSVKDIQYARLAS